MTCGIYMITNTANGKHYVGQSVRIEGRVSGHLRGKGHCPYLANAIKKYGRENFSWEILKRCSPWNLTKWEQYYMNRISPEYNLTPAAGSVLGIKWSDQSRQKLSKSLKGRKVDPEVVARMRETQKTSMLGNSNSKGTVPSAETREKISKAKMGHPPLEYTPELRQKLSIANKLQWTRRKAKQEQESTA